MRALVADLGLTRIATSTRAPDVYALGCILYEMLTGGLPYSGTSLRHIVTRILRTPIPSAGRLNPDLPRAVDRAIGCALAKTLSERFATMGELAAALAVPAAG